MYVAAVKRCDIFLFFVLVLCVFFRVSSAYVFAERGSTAGWAVRVFLKAYLLDTVNARTGTYTRSRRCPHKIALRNFYVAFPLVGCVRRIICADRLGLWSAPCNRSIPLGGWLLLVVGMLIEYVFWRAIGDWRVRLVPCRRFVCRRAMAWRREGRSGWLPDHRYLQYMTLRTIVAIKLCKRRICLQ